MQDELSQIVAQLETVANRLRRLSSATPPETRPKSRNASGGLPEPSDARWVTGTVVYSAMRFSPTGKEHRRVGLKLDPREDGLAGGDDVLYCSLWDVDVARDCPLEKGERARICITTKRSDRGEFHNLVKWEFLETPAPARAVPSEEIPF